MKSLDEVLSYAKLPFELAPLQRSEIERLMPYARSALFWDVGGGKTVGATLIVEAQDVECHVVITWPILMEQWRRWLAAVFPDQTVAVFYGPKRSAETLKARWVITSHHLFRSDFRLLVQAYAGRSHSLIVDEAQGLKNTGSKLFKYTNSFSAGQPLVLATGTPTTSPEDAYAYVKLKTPEVYRSLGHFQNLHVVDRDFFGAVTEWRDLEEISDNLMLQASKVTKEALFGDSLNPPIFQTIPYELAPAHMKLYKQLVNECLLEYENGTKIDGTTPQKLFHLVQQMVLNWAHFADDPKVRPAGLDLLDATIETTQCLDKSKSKLLVWTYHQLSSGFIHKYVKENFDPNAVAAYGKTDSKKAVASFMFDPECRIMVAHPLSVGAGLNAMEVCWEMLLLEFSTVPMHIRQIIGRVDRMGQRHIPTIRFGKAVGTLQERLLTRLLSNDDNVSIVERNVQTLRAALLGG